MINNIIKIKSNDYDEELYLPVILYYIYLKNTKKFNELILY